jgi:hypothetical protein
MTAPLGLRAKSDNYLRIVLTDTKTGAFIPTPANGTPATVAVTLVDSLGVTQLNAQSVPYTGAGGLYEQRFAYTAFPVVGTYIATWAGTDATGRQFNIIEPVIVVQ